MEDSSRSQERATYVKQSNSRIKKDKIEALRDNTQIHYLGIGRYETQTYWSKGGTLLSVPQLTARLIEILKMFK